MLLRTRIASTSAVLLSTVAAGAVLSPIATAAPAQWSFNVSATSAGVADGGELAIYPQRRQLFIADSDFYVTRKGSEVTVEPHALAPKVTKFSLATRTAVGAVDYSGQPWGVMTAAGVPVLPAPQVPDGIALDTTHGRVITTNSHVDGITVASVDAPATNASNLITLPGAHPMGAVSDDRANRAYVGLNERNSVLVIDTVTRRQVGEIGGLYAAGFLAIDTSRHRLYVGNSDFEKKKTNFVAVVDTRTDRVIKKIPTPSNSRPVLDPATGRVIAASYDTGKISVIDPASLSVVKTVDTGTTPNKIVIDNKRRLLYTSNLQRRTVTVLDADTDQVITTVPVGAPVNGIVVDEKTGTVYATQHQSGKLTVITVSRR